MGRHANEALLLATRAIYSMQWYVLGPATEAMLSALRASGALSGLLPLSFIAGASATQLLAPPAASRAGARMTYAVGLLLLSTADLLIPFSSSLAELVVLRSLAGLGAGLFFSPAAYMLLVIGGARGTTSLMSLYEAMFNVGGVLAIAWGLVDGLLGWRYGTALAGLVGLAAAVLNMVAIDVESKPPPLTGSLRSGGLRLVGVSLAGAGLFGASYLVGALAPYIAERLFGVSPYGAGALTLVYFVGNLVGAVAAYRAGAPSPRKVATAFIIASASMAFVALPTYEAFLVGEFINGLATAAAFTIYYSFSVEAFSRENSTSSLALVNFVNMIGSLAVYPLGGYLAYAASRYALAATLAAYSAAFAAALAAARPQTPT